MLTVHSVIQISYLYLSQTGNKQFTTGTSPQTTLSVALTITHIETLT